MCYNEKYLSKIQPFFLLECCMHLKMFLGRDAVRRLSHQMMDKLNAYTGIRKKDVSELKQNKSEIEPNKRMMVCFLLHRLINLSHNDVNKIKICVTCQLKHTRRLKNNLTSSKCHSVAEAYLLVFNLIV